MHDYLRTHDLVPDSVVAARVVDANWAVAETLTDLAFRLSPDGDEATLAYMCHVVATIATEPTIEVVIDMHRALTIITTTTGSPHDHG